MLNRSMNGAEALIKALIENDVDTVFGYPGGAVLPVYDAIFKNNRIKHILVRHEQAAVHAAEGFAPEHSAEASLEPRLSSPADLKVAEK